MFERILHIIGYGLCHQLPERSFFSGGFQLPVCARDTGIYIGFAIGLVALAWLAKGSRPQELPRWPVLVVIGLFVAAMGFDGVTSYAGWRTTTNDIRLITGLLTGWGLAALTLPMVNGQIWERPGPGRVPDRLTQVGAWLGMLVVTWVIARFVFPLTGALYPAMLVVAIIVTFGAVNLVFMGLLPIFERKASRLRDAWLPILLAQVLTVLELGGAAWLRTVVERLASR